MVAAGVSPDLAKWNPLVAVAERVEEGNEGGAEGEGVIRLGPELRRPVVILRRARGRTAGRRGIPEPPPFIARRRGGRLSLRSGQESP